MNRWKTLLLTLALAVPLGAPPAAAEPQAPPPPAPIVDDETQPVHSRADALTETVFVEVAGTDSDADGRPDRVAVDIMRPAATAAGLKVPVIMEASPYYAGGNDVANHVVDLDGSDPAGMEYRRNKFRDLREQMFGEEERAGARSAVAPPFPGYYDN
ncbi:CocE/NonD family hydrolase [Planomonospora corallina]|uniref:CocE/NonD family hydrolase n=1 Tax=Planomonospora corallina TaxID=1806052 RepID=A0ABV8IFW6_9ACTN